jgi:hypothetical protein
LRANCVWSFGIASASVAAFAIDPSSLLLIQKGPAVLKPQFQVNETFNDNVTYRQDDRQSDLVSTVSPGLALQLGTKEYNFIELTYFFDWVKYADHSELDTTQNRISLLSHFAKSRLSLDGNDDIEFLSSPLGGGISLSGQRVDRTSFYDRYRLSYDYSEKTGLYVQGMHNAADYEDDLALYDQRTLTGTLGFQYKAFSRAFFFGEAYFGQTDTERNLAVLTPYPTADFAGIFVGAHGDFTEHLSGSAKAGYEHRYYSDGGDSLDAPVVEITLDERFTEKTMLSLSYTRQENESVQFVRSPYTTDIISAHLRQEIGNENRMHADLVGSYVSADYEGNPAFGLLQRHDDFLNAGLTFSYDIKLWFRAFGSYNFEYFESNAAGILDYVVNRFTVGLQLGY